MPEFWTGLAIGTAVLLGGGGWIAAWSWQKGRAYQRAMQNIDTIQNERDEVTP